MCGAFFDINIILLTFNSILKSFCFVTIQLKKDFKAYLEHYKSLSVKTSLILLDFSLPHECIIRTGQP